MTRIPMGLLRATRAAVLALAAVLSVAAAGATDPVAPDTRRMAAALARLGRNYDERLVAQQPDLDLARYLRHVHAPIDTRSRLLLEAAYAYSQLVHGDAAAAAASFRAVKRAIPKEPSLANDHQLYNIV